MLAFNKLADYAFMPNYKPNKIIKLLYRVSEANPYLPNGTQKIEAALARRQPAENLTPALCKLHQPKIRLKTELKRGYDQTFASKRSEGTKHNIAKSLIQNQTDTELKTFHNRFDRAGKSN